MAAGLLNWVYQNIVDPVARTYVTLPCLRELPSVVIPIIWPASVDDFVQASLLGRVNEVRSLKVRVSNINGCNSGGWSALMAASERGHFEVVEEILHDHPIRIDQKNRLNGRTSIMQASRNGHTSLVNLLLDRTAEINSADNDGWTSLMLAVWQGQEQVVRTLLRRGADKTATNNHGETAHAIAIQHGRVQIAPLLVV